MPVFGRPARMVWRNQRCRCPDCRRTWIEQYWEIASARCVLTTSAARWPTLQVGSFGRSVAEVVDDLGCDWHTVIDAVERFGTPLMDEPNRFSTAYALELDGTLFCREARSRAQCWSAQIYDLRRFQLFDGLERRDNSARARRATRRVASRC